MQKGSMLRMLLTATSCRHCMDGLAAWTMRWQSCVPKLHDDWTWLLVKLLHAGGMPKKREQKREQKRLKRACLSAADRKGMTRQNLQH